MSCLIIFGTRVARYWKNQTTKPPTRLLGDAGRGNPSNCLNFGVANVIVCQNLREPQHTPGAYPRHPQTPKWKEFLHKLLVGGLGYAPGVCWKVLRQKLFFFFGQKKKHTELTVYKRLRNCTTKLQFVEKHRKHPVLLFAQIPLESLD